MEERDRLLEAVREHLGHGADGQRLAEGLERIRKLIGWARSIDQDRLLPVEPAGAFRPEACAPPAAGSAPAWASLEPPGFGGAGYGGPPPTEHQRHGTTPADGPVGLPVPGLAGLPLHQAAAMIRRREVSPVEVAEACLERIEHLNPRLNAFITVTGEQALEQARKIEGALARGEDPGPLAGIPVALKDIIETAGVRTTAGSKVLAGYVPIRDATVVSKLSEAGAIVIGKTSTHEFAMGTTNVNPHYGPCRNPWLPSRVSGGSSGGSAVAVATGMSYAGLGTDTGGSVRIPAACCGVVGLKPTYGRVSRYGVIPLSWSLDHVGPLTRTVRDAALMLTVLAGPDPMDPTASGREAGDYVAAVDRAGEGLKGLRLGVPRGWVDGGRVQPGVLKQFQRALSVLEGLGATVAEVDYPPSSVLSLTNRLLLLAESAAYHAPYLERSAELYGLDCRVRLEAGGYMLAGDYLLGQRLRAELAAAVADVMDEVEVIVTPTLPVAAPGIDQDTVVWNIGVETVTEAMIRYTAAFNTVGLPAVAVPCGLSDGLPVSLQLSGRAYDEAEVLRAAAAFELATGGRVG